MANNKFDIKVFTDELNKAFTILKKEQVLEKYMKNVLLNYNSIIYIGNITDEPNKYNTIYNYMYGEDNTLCNIVVFETDGFVDSESNIIPSGIHIAYPYLDYSVCIDYKYILNINNSAELLTPTQEYKTINNESILGTGNIETGLPARQYEISTLHFDNFSVGQSITISARDSAIIENARTNKASVIFNDAYLIYLPLLYVEVADDVQVLYNDFYGNCGVVSINTRENSARVLSVFNNSKSTDENTISFIECSPGAQLDSDTLQKLLTKKYGLYITGNMFFPTSEDRRFYTVPYFNYFGTSIQLGYKSVAINQANYLEQISTYSIDLDIKKTYPYSKSDVYLDKKYIIRKNTNLTNIGIAIGFNSYCHESIKETINDKRFNHLLSPNFANSFNFKTVDNGKKVMVAVDLVDILKSIFSYNNGGNFEPPTVELNPSSPIYPKIWSNGNISNYGVLKCLCKLRYPMSTDTDLTNLYNGITYGKFSRKVQNKFKHVDNYGNSNKVNRLIRLSIILNLNYNEPNDFQFYDRGWTGTMIDYYYEILLVPDIANKDIYVYYRINRFK